jgi:cyclopropane fatty-acyl-phospholipid synthase-like methyltransferase
MVMFLTDEGSVALLKRCKEHLKKGGIVLLKDIIVLSENRRPAVWCVQNRSFSRTVFHLSELIAWASLKVHFRGEQLIPLSCFVLQKSGMWQAT